MVICDRLRALRQETNVSEGDIEKQTGLLCCYISRDDGLLGFDIRVNVIWRVLSCQVLSVFEFAEASQFSKS